MAAPRPTALAMSGVPASNFSGAAWNVVLAKVTSRIICPCSHHKRWSAGDQSPKRRLRRPREIGADAGEQDGHTVRLRFAQEMFETLEKDDIGIARAADAQDDVGNGLGLRAARDLIEVAVGSGAAPKKSSPSR